MTDHKKPYKIVCCGCLEVGYDLVRGILRQGFKIDYFVTITPEKAVQANASGYIHFKNLATEFGIPIYYAKKYSLKAPEDIAFFQKHRFDLLIQGGWQRLFPNEILSTLHIGAIGAHGSSDFLPRGRGRSPVNWSLIEGKRRFILHFFLIKPGIDDGDVFHYEMFDINEWDDCKTLYYKISLINKRVLISVIPKLLEGKLKSYPQIGEPTYYPKRIREDGLINWSRSVFEVYDFVRAITKPYPGAFTYLGGNKVTLWRVQPFDTRIDDHSYKIGQIVEIFTSSEFLVKCSGGLLLVREYETNVKLVVNDIFDSTT